MRRFAVKKTGGGISVMRVMQDDIDPQDEIDKWSPEEQAEVVSVREITEADIPNDREFRDAWEDDGAKVKINLIKARAIHADRIERARAKEIARLERAEQTERLAGNSVKADQTARLRTDLEALDLNALENQITNADAPEALSAIWPAKLPRQD